MTVSDLLEQPCNKSDSINKVVATDSINKVVASCSILVDNLGQAVRAQLVGGFATRCEIFARVVDYLNK